MALWFLNFSTWRGVHGIYLEDLYVRPAARRGGHGRALLRELARIADARGYERLDWAVLDWNTPAQDFYRSLGAFPTDEWTGWRLERRGARRARRGPDLAAPDATRTKIAFAQVSAARTAVRLRLRRCPAARACPPCSTTQGRLTLALDRPTEHRRTPWPCRQCAAARSATSSASACRRSAPTSRCCVPRRPGLRPGSTSPSTTSRTCASPSTRPARCCWPRRRPALDARLHLRAAAGQR